MSRLSGTGIQILATHAQSGHHHHHHHQHATQLSGL